MTPHSGISTTTQNYGLVTSMTTTLGDINYNTKLQASHLHDNHSCCCNTKRNISIKTG